MSERKKKVDLLIGADHAGFELKECILKILSAKGVRFEDVGNL